MRFRFHLLRFILLAALALGASPASAQQMPLPGLGDAAPAPIRRIDPLLQTVATGQPVQAVLTFDHYPTAGELAALRTAGLKARPFRALPMVAVQGKSLQLERLPALPGLRSLTVNRRLDYFSGDGVALAGARRAGGEAGIAIAVIDAGIDATHPDLRFGSKVVQNVKLAPDLFGTGPLVLEGLANTDTPSGRGTQAAAIAGGGGATLVGIGAGDAPTLLTALQAFDWVLQNHLRYGIRVVSGGWEIHEDDAAEEPISVASKLADSAGLVVVFAAPQVAATAAELLEGNPALTPDEVKSRLEKGR